MGGLVVGRQEAVGGGAAGELQVPKEGLSRCGGGGVAGS